MSDQIKFDGAPVPRSQQGIWLYESLKVFYVIWHVEDVNQGDQVAWRKAELA